MSEHELFALIELTDVELNAVYGGASVNTTRSNIKNASVTSGDGAVASSSITGQSESIASFGIK